MSEEINKIRAQLKESGLEASTQIHFIRSFLQSYLSASNKKVAFEQELAEATRHHHISTKNGIDGNNPYFSINFKRDVPKSLDAVLNEPSVSYDVSFIIEKPEKLDSISANICYRTYDLLPKLFPTAEEDIRNLVLSDREAEAAKRVMEQLGYKRLYPGLS